VRVGLEPLDVREGADYLVHHLRAAGARPEAIITDEALELLVRTTGGVPRLLNQAAHQALCLACSGQATQVDAEAALEALAQLGLEAESTEDAPGAVIIDEATPAEEESIAPARRLFPPTRRPA
jgi:hypothetical protein